MIITKLESSLCIPLGDPQVLREANRHEVGGLFRFDPRSPDQQIADGLRIHELINKVAARDHENRQLRSDNAHLAHEQKIQNRMFYAALVAVLLLLGCLATAIGDLHEIAGRWL